MSLVGGKWGKGREREEEVGEEGEGDRGRR